ncbi:MULTISPECIES: hypothetical protein [unclassified Rhizobium]|nr:MULTISPECIES: hypothetical protein [unclassified Rhizobium]
MAMKSSYTTRWDTIDELGIPADHSTIYRWIQQHTHGFEKRLRRH